MHSMTIQEKISPRADLAAIKARQQMSWSSGDYAIVGNTLQIVGERLCEAVNLNSNHRVLDVAAGNGNATLAAARHFAEVVSTDYVDALLQRGRDRANAERLAITFQVADAENLPFADASFNIVLSTFGVMFTPDHEQAAREMLRVCRSGGRIGLANWTPEGFVGQLFKTIGKYVPPPPGLRSPAMWGTRPHLEQLFGGAAEITAETRTFSFRYKSPAHFLAVFSGYYGPVLNAFAALDADGQKGLEADLLALMNSFNVSRDGSLVAPSSYLEVVITKR